MKEAFRRWFVRENGYRDVWLLLITGIVLFVAITVYNNQRADTKALCAVRADVQRRYDSGVEFLKTHPNGAFGISAAAIRVQLRGEKGTLTALRPLVC